MRLTKEQENFNEIGKTIAKHMDNVDNIYIDIVDNHTFIVVEFRGGAISVRNAEANGLILNLAELTKLLYGGYYKEVDYYKTLRDKATPINESTADDNFAEFIKDWYQREFADDEQGEYLDPSSTFYDLFIALDTYQDVYEVLGDSADSLIRERAFSRLAELMEVDYDYIYDQWLMAN